MVLPNFKPCETENLDKRFSMELFLRSFLIGLPSEIKSTVSTPHSMQKISLKTYSSLLLNTSTIKFSAFFFKVKPRSRGLRVSVKSLSAQGTSLIKNISRFFSRDLAWYEKIDLVQNLEVSRIYTFLQKTSIVDFVMVLKKGVSMSI